MIEPHTETTRAHQ